MGIWKINDNLTKIMENFPKLWKNDQNFGKLTKNCEKINKILENWPIIFQNYELNILNDVVCDSQHEKCIFSFLFCIKLGFHGLAFLQLCNKDIW